MGSCNYYLKATWPKPLTGEQVKEIETFFVEMDQADNYHWKHSECMIHKKKKWNFTKEFLEKFPRVADFVKFTGSTALHVNGDADVMDRLVIDGSEVRYSNEVSHMADWTPLCDYLRHKYGAVYTSWLSEESDGVDPGSVLDYEDDKAIVDAILEQDEKSLPAFLGIHPLLDARISSKLSRKE